MSIADLMNGTVDIDDPENMDSASEDGSAFSGELHAIAESISAASQKLLVMEQIYTDYKTNRITPEQVKYVNFAIESIIADRNTPITANIIAVEHLGERIIEGIRGLVSMIHLGVQKYIDYVHYINTFFNLQSGRLASIRRKLDRISSSSNTATFRIGVNKYMMFGENKHVVSSASEYLSQYKLMAESMVPFLDATTVLTKEDLFSGLKIYKDYIFNDPEDFIMDQFNALEKHLNGAKRGIGSHVAVQNPMFQEFRSPYLLGMSQVMVRLPKSSTYKHSDIESCLDAFRHFYMCLDRKMKINFGSLLEGGMHLSMTKRDAVALLDQSEALLKSADALLQLSVRLSNEGAFIDADLTRYRNRDNAELTGFALHGFRIYARTCSVIYDSVSSGYNFTLGNVKQALTICEKVSKAL